MARLAGRFHRCTALFFCLLALGANVAAEDAVDPDVTGFRGALARAIASNDIEALNELAFETATDGVLASEVTQLKTVVQQSIVQAFKNRLEALTGARAILNLADEGQARGVGAADLALARAKAKDIAQAKLDAWLASGDVGAIQEALGGAVRAGASAVSIAAAQTKIREAAAAALAAAMAGNDLGSLMTAIDDATAGGVPADDVAVAVKARSDQILKKLSDARASNDLQVKLEAMNLAVNSEDASLAVRAASAREALVDLVNSTVDSASDTVSSNFSRLQVAVDLAGTLGMSSDATFADGLAEAQGLVHAVEAKAAARAAVTAAKASQDWWALLDAAQNARDAGIPDAEVAAASAAAAEGARAVVLAAQGGTAGAGLSDVQAAWELGHAAGLPTADLSNLVGKLAEGAKAKLQAALSAGSIPEVAAVLRGGRLSGADQNSGQEALRTKVAAWISSSGSASSQDVGGTLQLLNSLTPCVSMLSPGQLGQVVGVFQLQLFTELRTAAAAVALGRLDIALRAAKSGRRQLVWAVPEDEPEDSPVAVGARAKEEELGRLLSLAGQVQQRERAKVESIDLLREAMRSIGLSDLRIALAAAREVGCAASDLAPFDTEFANRGTEVGRARNALHVATRGTDFAALDIAIKQAELAGMDFEEPTAMAAARARLTELPPQVLPDLSLVGTTTTLAATTTTPQVITTTGVPLPDLSFVDMAGGMPNF